MKWLRIWTVETYHGTTFTELNAAERGIWFSLLVLAGLGPREGFIELRKGVGYDPGQLAGSIQVDEDVLMSAIIRLIELKKVVTVPRKSSEFPLKVRLKIRNWNRYQTEYQRYRKGKTAKGPRVGLTSSKTTLDDPPGQSKSESKTKSESKKNAKKPPAFAVEFQEVWNSHPELPRIDKMTAGRVRQLGIRRRDQDFCTKWKDAIAALAKSSFHTGRNDRNWRADVKWFLKNDDIWLSVLERNDYGNGKSGKYGRLCADD